ncbi:MAG TPA: hypothetical protein VEH04_11400 [Verrucomicrobiae bacterium]|nr:hypothetical protein [Verrucomicrobiae bacterium]
MLSEIYTRKIKAIAGNGTTSLKIRPSEGKRVHGMQLQLIVTLGTDTLAALCAALTIRVLVGTTEKWKLTGTKLRDFCLLRGTTYDFDGTPSTGCQITLPFAPEWFLDNVADALAWNPRRLGDAITVEVDCSAAMNATVFERISDDLDAPSAGILTLEVINPIAGGTNFVVDDEIDVKGRLLQASIYPDSTNNREITPVSVFLGTDDVVAIDDVTSAQNDEALARFGMTPAPTGRTANIFDAVFVKSDALVRGIDIASWGRIKIKVGAAAAMSGTCDILLVRLEQNPS